MKTGMLRTVIIIATAVQLLTSTAQSNPVKILVYPPPGGGPGISAGDLSLLLTVDPNSGPPGTGLST